MDAKLAEFLNEKEIYFGHLDGRPEIVAGLGFQL